MHSPTFYLSKDKSYLMDAQGSNMYSVVQEKERIYYKPIAIESEAFDKVCLSSTSIKVCSRWDDKHGCVGFEFVNVCTQWELVPKGFGNIS